MSLYISVNTPTKDYYQSPIDNAITFFAASIAMEKRVGSFPEGPKLDITFSLTTKQDAPDYNGMRMGPYDDRNKTLYFETVVPPHMTQSRVAPQYVQAVLEDVIDNAQDYFSDLGVKFDFNQWQEVITKLSHTESTNNMH
jgi:hypothetical protein